MLDVLVISLGAIVGANARYFISRYAARVLGPVFPYGTLFINVVGSLVVGFCGSLTTFSSYAYETMAYFEQGQWLLMLTNFVSNNLLCLGGGLAGMALARVL